MTPIFSRRMAALVVLAALASGCTVSGLPTNPANGKPGANGSNTNVNPAAGPLRNEPLEPIAGVEFKPITAGTSKFLSNNGNGVVQQGTGNAAAPMTPAATKSANESAAADSIGGATFSDGASGGGSAGMAVGAPAPASISARPAGAPAGTGGGGAVSGNVYSYYGYGSYFGGNGADQMALVSMQQAEVAGAKGGFADIVKNVAAPIVSAWAADARLVQSGAMVDNDGNLLAAPAGPDGKMMDIAMMPGYYGGGYGEGSGWQFTYASSSLSEVLTFAVTGEKTVILRMKWAQLSLAPERVLTDSGSAIKKLIAAIKDKGFASEEEKTGKDYFLNFPFEQPANGGVYNDEYNRNEVVYDVPGNARWNVSLQQVMGKLVWQLNYYAPYEENGGGIAMPMPAPVPMMARAEAGVAVDDAMVKEEPKQPEPCPSPKWVEEQGWFNNSAQGMVDAETGAVIRFTRPTRNYYRHQVWEQDCIAYPEGYPGKGTPPMTTAAPPPDAPMGNIK